MARKKGGLLDDEWDRGFKAAWEYIFGRQYSTKKVKTGLPSWVEDMLRVKKK